MAKQVLTLRVDPSKKSDWSDRAKRSDMNLSQWIESMCDRPDECDFRPGDFIKVTSDGVAHAKPEPDGSIRAIVGQARALMDKSLVRHAPNCGCMSCRGGK